MSISTGDIVFPTRVPAFRRILPGSRENTEANSTAVYSKRSKLASKHIPFVLGHRGLRMNSHPDDLVRENTILSLKEGWHSGATWVEFDVQLTKDGVPVLWHDDHVITLMKCDPENSQCAMSTSHVASQAAEVSSLTLAEFRLLASGSSVEHEGRLHQLARRFQKDGPILPWTCQDNQEDKEAAPVTLQEVLAGAPMGLGFDVELKLMDCRSSTPQERTQLLERTLQVLKEHGGDRQVVFSSFCPEACVEMRQMQSTWPVFMLTALAQAHVDPRCRTLQAASQVAIEFDLDGVVANNEKIFEEADQIPVLTNAGLQLFTYGSANCDSSLIAKQISLGVTGLCTDDVILCLKAVFDSQMNERGNSLHNFSEFFDEGLAKEQTQIRQIAVQA